MNIYSKSPKEVLDFLEQRNLLNDENIENQVKKIIFDVKENKDEALKKYSYLFDQAKLERFDVSKDEMDDAILSMDQKLMSDFDIIKQNIESYHEKQILNTIIVRDDNNIKIKQRIKPIESVGIYIPGGTAAYPSTVFMSAIPAKIAGVKRIVMVTPPMSDGKIKPSILAAAKLSGVSEIFKVGGAQAIAALTYGTPSIPKVDMIVGPGNIYVATAKKLLIGQVGIDMIAGPTEVVILADGYANPKFIAADLMAQAEHDLRSSSILITTSRYLAEEVNQEIEKQIKTLSRKDIIKKALNDYGAIILVDTLDEAIYYVNQIAPEHLELMIDNAFDIVDRIENAGSIFVGNYTPEPLGDYYAGPNHTLPTSRTARFSSPLSTTTFYKKTSVLYYDQTSLEQAKDSIVRLANEEGLDGHAQAIRIRFED